MLAPLSKSSSSAFSCWACLAIDETDFVSERPLPSDDPTPGPSSAIAASARAAAASAMPRIQREAIRLRLHAKMVLKDDADWH